MNEGKNRKIKIAWIIVCACILALNIIVPLAWFLSLYVPRLMATDRSSIGVKLEMYRDDPTSSLYSRENNTVYEDADKAIYNYLANMNYKECDPFEAVATYNYGLKMEMNSLIGNGGYSGIAIYPNTNQISTSYYETWYEQNEHFYSVSYEEMDGFVKLVKELTL